MVLPCTKRKGSIVGNNDLKITAYTSVKERKMAARYYKHNGKDLPSVTTITGQLDKAGLTYWAANCAADYILDELEKLKSDRAVIMLDDILPIVEKSRKEFTKVSAKALDIGSAVHATIERYLKTREEPQEPSSEIWSAFIGFLSFLDRWKSWETIMTEHTMYADRFAGTCDWITMLNSNKYIVDFKTYNENASKKPPYEEHKCQTAAYRSMDDTVVGNGALYLGKKTGKVLWFDFSNTYEHDLKVFQALTDLWHTRKEK